MQIIKPGTNIDFMGKTKLAVAASSAAVLLSLFGILVWPGPASASTSPAAPRSR